MCSISRLHCRSAISNKLGGGTYQRNSTLVYGSGGTQAVTCAGVAKINTLESEGKCFPSSKKSTKHASQFDLQLTRDKQKFNLRAYRLGFQISLTQAYRQTLPIEKTTKNI